MPAAAGLLFSFSATAAVGSAAIGAAIGGALLKLALSVALSKLQQVMLKKQLSRNGGIATDTTVSGESMPEAFQLGMYATGGHMVGPPMSYGSKNKYLIYVIEIASMPGVALRRLIIDNEYNTLAATAHPNFDLEGTGKYAGNLWVKYYDGAQLAVDPELLFQFSARSTRPWSIDMIGAGLTYAVIRFSYNENVYRSLPTVRFEVDGIPLYDPRLDTSVGGSGAHRWANKATWEVSPNPMVMAYNIQRGIELPGGRVWGLGVSAADLPLSSWFTAMNACDAPQPTGMTTEPAYRAGTEVMVDDEPADVLDQLMVACAGEIVDVGGIWKAAAGPPGLPVYSFTDDDVLISSQQDFDPFPGLDETFNGVHARYPDPTSLWETKDAPPRYNTTYEAEDLGKQLMADLELPTVPWKYQVQRLQKAYIEEERRFRRHVIYLPPEAALLEPLDTVAWTSTRNGYSAKLFEVTEVKLNLRTLIVAVNLRERDPTDYDWTAPEEIEVDDTDADYIAADPIEVDGFAVVGTSIEDAAAVARRPAAEFSWTAADMAETEGLDWEIKVQASGVVVAQGTTAATDAGTLIVSEGLLANVTYEGRMRAVVNGLTTVWTAWTAFTTPNTLLVDIDIGDQEVTRPKIEDFAVTDIWQTIQLGPYTGVAPTFPSLVILATIATGPVPAGQIRRRAYAFFGRKSGGTAGAGIRVVVEFRKKQKGGGWTAWDEVNAWQMDTVTDGYSGSGNIAEEYDDLEYRLGAASTSFAGGQYTISEIYMTVLNLVK